MKRLFFLAAAMLLGACAGPSRAPIITAPTASNDDFSRLAAQVETEIRAAEKTGFLWRDTTQLLNDARTAQREGRREEAMQLATRALRQAQLAQQQARDNANAAPNYPKP